jgi:hypothetical protein
MTLGGKEFRVSLKTQGGHAGRNEKKRNGECIESQEGGLRTTAFLKVAQKILLK